VLQLYAIFLPRNRPHSDRAKLIRRDSLARAMPVPHMYTHGKREEEEAMPALSPSIRINGCPTDDHVALHLAAGSW
jgi:hypothetical protein